MPRYRKSANVNLNEFIDAIAEEIQANARPGVPPADPFTSAEQKPVIFEEATGVGDRFRVMVVWDKWSGLSIEDRNRVILEAYRRVLKDSVRNVSLTLGLTRHQFERMSPGAPQWFGA